MLIVKKINYIILLLLLAFSAVCGQVLNALDLSNTAVPDDSIKFVQVKTDSLFNSKQIISMLILRNDGSDNLNIEFGYSRSELRPTSTLAETKNALAAINGGFFDMTKGGSVSYFEVNDTVINFTHPSEARWAKPASIINGAIVLTKENKIIIEPAETDSFYFKSGNEAAVLLTGPLLLLNGEKFKLQETDFVKKRHPRTFLCTSRDYVLLITVDGRSEDAEGMNLIEAQEFLLSIGSVDAINLDGGGSTSMWIKAKGIVNYPSDKTGERPVANALLIIKNGRQSIK
jgi:exopolysaccharide biosynthesis protein